MFKLGLVFGAVQPDYNKKEEDKFNVQMLERSIFKQDDAANSILV